MIDPRISFSAEEEKRKFREQLLNRLLQRNAVQPLATDTSLPPTELLTRSTQPLLTRLLQNPDEGLQRPRTLISNSPLNVPLGNDLPQQGGYMGDIPLGEGTFSAMQDSINAQPDGSPLLTRTMTPPTAEPPPLVRRIGDYQSQPPDASILIRPRRVNVDSAPSVPLDNGQPAPGQEPFGSSGEPFGSTRLRRTQPRDYIADDAQYLRDLEASHKERGRVPSILLRTGLGLVSGGIPGAISGAADEAITHRYGRGGQQNKIEGAREQLATDLGIGREQAQTRSENASIYEKLTRAPSGSTRIVGDGEYPGVPSGTEIRQTWNGREMVDVVGQNGKPIVSKAPPAEKAAAREIKYNQRREAVLVPKDGGPAMPIFNQDGTPLTKEANESGNVQTAYRLANDGITQVQIERDGNTGQWVDSVGRNGQPLVRGRVGRIDPTTGAPMSTVITNNRLVGQQGQEDQRKRQSYEGEAKEWGNKETTFRQNKAAEDQAINTKTAQLEALYSEKPSEWGGLVGGPRTREEIETEKARLIKEIGTHRTNAAHFQTEADKAASSATESRRNAGLYADSGGAQGVIGRAPASDGKHHYTTAEIRAQAGSSGVSYESLYQKLKANQRVVIDQ
ncbi:MAG TPA: hypothetical protein DHU55_01470 [Blastocatellia bacterium]|nr:hypothetical protein [Blastocatellia bacterium]